MKLIENNKPSLILVFSVFMLLSIGCQTVKPYQRAYLNDESMQAGKSAIQGFSGHVHDYREGATGGGETRGSGGCGCN